MVNPIDLVDDLIADLEAKLGLQPGESLPTSTEKLQQEKKPKKEKKQAPQPKKQESNIEDQPDICKLEFKVGQITKVWTHPDADKLYCEEIDIGEDSPRQIASGLRPHFTEVRGKRTCVIYGIHIKPHTLLPYSKDQMLGQRLLVVSNLKAKNLVGFKSHGMVLCAAEPKDDGGELVQFVEPPAEATIGEVVFFEGLPVSKPWSAAQVDKKKVFATCMEGMRTTDDRKAAWNGHVFMTSAGPCTTKTIAGGVMR
jgi:aminoacyl tRNA synthase complex-interacting multifunctional protein 1